MAHQQVKADAVGVAGDLLHCVTQAGDGLAVRISGAPANSKHGRCIEGSGRVLSKNFFTRDEYPETIPTIVNSSVLLWIEHDSLVRIDRVLDIKKLYPRRETGGWFKKRANPDDSEPKDGHVTNDLQALVYGEFLSHCYDRVVGFTTFKKLKCGTRPQCDMEALKTIMGRQEQLDRQGDLKPLDDDFDRFEPSQLKAEGDCYVFFEVVDEMDQPLKMAIDKFKINSAEASYPQETRSEILGTSDIHINRVQTLYFVNKNTHIFLRLAITQTNRLVLTPSLSKISALLPGIVMPAANLPSEEQKATETEKLDNASFRAYVNLPAVDEDKLAAVTTYVQDYYGLQRGETNFFYEQRGETAVSFTRFIHEVMTTVARPDVFVRFTPPRPANFPDGTPLIHNLGALHSVLSTQWMKYCQHPKNDVNRLFESARLITGQHALSVPIPSKRRVYEKVKLLAKDLFGTGGIGISKNVKSPGRYIPITLHADKILDCHEQLLQKSIKRLMDRKIGTSPLTQFEEIGTISIADLLTDAAFARVQKSISDEAALDEPLEEGDLQETSPLYELIEKSAVASIANRTMDLMHGALTRGWLDAAQMKEVAVEGVPQDGKLTSQQLKNWTAKPTLAAEKNRRADFVSSTIFQRLVLMAVATNQLMGEIIGQQWHVHDRAAQKRLLKEQMVCGQNFKLDDLLILAAKTQNSQTQQILNSVTELDFQESDLVKRLSKSTAICQIDGEIYANENLAFWSLFLTRHQLTAHTRTVEEAGFLSLTENHTTKLRKICNLIAPQLALSEPTWSVLISEQGSKPSILLLEQVASWKPEGRSLKVEDSVNYFQKKDLTIFISLAACQVKAGGVTPAKGVLNENFSSGSQDVIVKLLKAGHQCMRKAFHKLACHKINSLLRNIRQPAVNSKKPEFNILASYAPTASGLIFENCGEHYWLESMKFGQKLLNSRSALHLMTQNPLRLYAYVNLMYTDCQFQIAKEILAKEPNPLRNTLFAANLGSYQETPSLQMIVAQVQREASLMAVDKFPEKGTIIGNEPEMIKNIIQDAQDYEKEPNNGAFLPTSLVRATRQLMFPNEPVLQSMAEPRTQRKVLRNLINILGSHGPLARLQSVPLEELLDSEQYVYISLQSIKKALDTPQIKSKSVIYEDLHMLDRTTFEFFTNDCLATVGWQQVEAAPRFVGLEVLNRAMNDVVRNKTITELLESNLPHLPMRPETLNNTRKAVLKRAQQEFEAAIAEFQGAVNHDVLIQGQNEDETLLKQARVSAVEFVIRNAIYYHGILVKLSHHSQTAVHTIKILTEQLILPSSEAQTHILQEWDNQALDVQVTKSDKDSSDQFQKLRGSRAPAMDEYPFVTPEITILYARGGTETTVDIPVTKEEARKMVAEEHKSAMRPYKQDPKKK